MAGTHWQVRAELDSGGVMVFGTQADSAEQALDAAHELLADAGRLVLQLEVTRLSPVRDR